MPPLLPLEAVEPAVADLRERRDLPFHGHLACAGEDIAAVVAGGGRILEERLPGLTAPPAPRVLRLFLSRQQGMMGGPPQPQLCWSPAPAEIHATRPGRS